MNNRAGFFIYFAIPCNFHWECKYWSNFSRRYC